MKTEKIRRPGRRVQITFTEPTVTKQEMREETNINLIMAKFQRTGMVSHLNEHQAQYSFATGDDFLASMLIINKAQDMFDELPSSVRKRFANSPHDFLEFVQNPDNADDLVNMGLSTAPPLPSPSPAASTPSVADEPPSTPPLSTKTAPAVPSELASDPPASPPG